MATLFALFSVCRAESAALRVEPPALPLACLSVPGADDALKYPADVDGQLDAVVRIEMTFSSAGAPPRVKTLFSRGDPAFEAVIARHVAGYRLPCLETGRSITLQQTFDFKGAKPSDVRALAFAARYAGVNELERRRCTVQGLGVEPRYPRGRDRLVLPGSVVVKVRFERGADEPPSVSILFDGGDSRLANAVLDIVKEYRLHCRAPLSEPVVARQTFAFLLDGAATTTLAESVTLAQLLRGTSNFDQQKVRFDLSTMGCPFEVLFAPYQPFAENTVEADLSRHPEREEFVRWISGLALDVPPRAMRTVIGNSTIVSVPCGVVDMT